MKNAVDIVYVILHYLTIDDTIECVDSIIAHNKDNTYKIVIVDNASPNGSGDRLKEKYMSNCNIDVLINESNLGFARGNNVGFRHAKSKYYPKYIAMINNDTIILQNSFYKQIDEEYEKSKFALLGPMIMTADGKCDCTPVSEKPLTRQSIEGQLKKESFRTKLLNMRLLFIVTACQRIKTALLGKEPVRENKDYIHKRENVRIHGCFMVFGREFIDNFDGLNEETFLYHEEEILHIQLMSKGYKTVYLPTIQIFHKEDSATNAISRKKKEAKKFAYNCSAESCRVLLKVYDECYSENKN